MVINLSQSTKGRLWVSEAEREESGVSSGVPSPALIFHLSSVMGGDSRITAHRQHSEAGEERPAPRDKGQVSSGGEKRSIPPAGPPDYTKSLDGCVGVGGGGGGCDSVPPPSLSPTEWRQRRNKAEVFPTVRMDPFWPRFLLMQMQTDVKGFSAPEVH